MALESSGNSYVLDVPDIASLPSVAYEDRKTMPMLGGVYFVYGPLGTVLYVGSSKNLRTRWIAHHRMPQMVATGGVRIAWVVVDLAAHRLALEHHCIEVLRPLYQQSAMPHRRNRDGKLVFDVTLHLPQPVYDRLSEASIDYTRTLPNQILYILERLINSGQLDKWCREPSERSSKGSRKRWRATQAPQLRLFIKH